MLTSQFAVLDLAKLSATEAARLDFPEQRAKRLGENLGHPDMELEKSMTLFAAAQSFLDEAVRLRKQKDKVGRLGETEAPDQSKKSSRGKRAEETSPAPNDADASPSPATTLFAAIADAGLPETALVNVILASAKISGENSRSGLMLESLLISAVAQFEVFISRLITASLRYDFSTLKASDKKYTFEDVSAHASLGDFTKAAADAHVDSLMYDGMQSWMKFLAKATRSDTAWVSDLLAEVVMRRNVHVHAGGRASTQYLVSLGKSAAAVKLGGYLPVSEKYLEDALDRMARAAIVLSQSAVASLCVSGSKDGAEALDSDQGIIDAVFDLLAAGRFQAVAPLAEQLEPLVKTNSTKERLRANSLWAQKKWYGDDAARSDIDAWDVSASEDEFKLAKHCLLNQNADALALYKVLSASGKLSVMELATWPILEPVRAAMAEETNPE